MGEVKISVALASYNGEKYIGEQIDSILASFEGGSVSEKIREYEIVVSDDGSTDSTLEILKEYRKRGVNLKILKGPGKGVKKNMENAIRHSRGKYIFLSDQDDLWMENKVERVMAYLGKKGCMLVNHDARVMDKELEKEIMPSFFAYRRSVPGFIPNFIKNRYMGCCMAFDRRLVPLILPVPGEIEMHDQWIGLISDMTGGKSLFLEEKLIWYRRHDNNVSDFSHGTVREMIRKRCVLARALFRWGKRQRKDRKK